LPSSTHLPKHFPSGLALSDYMCCDFCTSLASIFTFVQTYLFFPLAPSCVCLLYSTIVQDGTWSQAWCSPIIMPCWSPWLPLSKLTFDGNVGMSAALRLGDAPSAHDKSSSYHLPNSSHHSSRYPLSQTSIPVTPFDGYALLRTRTTAEGILPSRLPQHEFDHFLVFPLPQVELSASPFLLGCSPTTPSTPDLFNYLIIRSPAHPFFPRFFSPFYFPVICRVRFALFVSSSNGGFSLDSLQNCNSSKSNFIWAQRVGCVLILHWTRPEFRTLFSCKINSPLMWRFFCLSRGTFF